MTAKYGQEKGLRMASVRGRTAQLRKFMFERRAAASATATFFGREMENHRPFRRLCGDEVLS
jgi:hypothetical protein